MILWQVSVSNYQVHPYVGSPADFGFQMELKPSTGMMFCFFFQGCWGEVVSYERFESEISISHHGPSPTVETC